MRGGARTRSRCELITTNSSLNLPALEDARSLAEEHRPGREVDIVAEVPRAWFRLLDLPWKVGSPLIDDAASYEQAILMRVRASAALRAPNGTVDAKERRMNRLGYGSFVALLALSSCTGATEFSPEQIGTSAFELAQARGAAEQTPSDLTLVTTLLVMTLGKSADLADHPAATRGLKLEMELVTQPIAAAGRNAVVGHLVLAILTARQADVFSEVAANAMTEGIGEALTKAARVEVSPEADMDLLLSSILKTGGEVPGLLRGLSHDMVLASKRGTRDLRHIVLRCRELTDEMQKDGTLTDEQATALQAEIKAGETEAPR